jgi:signal transduction histidine kinase
LDTGWQTMRLPRGSLRARLALAFAAGTTIVFISVAAFIYIQLRSELLSTIDMGLRSRAQSLVANISNGGAQLGTAHSPLIDPDEAFAQVLTQQGRIVDATPAVSRRPLVDAAMLRGLHRATFVSTRPPGLDPSRLLVVPTTGVTPNGGPLYVVVGATRSDTQEALDRVVVLFAIAFPVALLASTGIGWLLAGAALRSVRRMSAEAEVITESDLTRRLPVPQTDDSLAQLATTLNETFDRLEVALERERGFVDNASHELRTPLTILKAEVDSALASPRSREELESALEGASQEVHHLVRIAEGLLVLARTTGHIPAHRTATPLPELLAASCGPFAQRAESLGVDLHSDAPDVIADIDATRVRQALDNLVDNALRHAAPGGAIRVTAATASLSVTISVTDSGPGFSEQVMGRIFQPFNRGVAQAEGTGLGLAIANAIAEAHAGEARAENLPEGGARVTLVLPVPVPPRAAPPRDAPPAERAATGADGG